MVTHQDLIEISSSSCIRKSDSQRNIFRAELLALMNIIKNLIKFKRILILSISALCNLNRCRKQSSDPYVLFAYYITLLYNILKLIAMCHLFTHYAMIQSLVSL